ncbi:hypothetical protein Tco_0812834 [Tanacetum coccineum]
MFIQPQTDVGEGLRQPTEPQHTPTEISQSSGPTTLVADKTINEERGDIMEMATTTAASLDAEQESGSGPRRQDTILGDRHAQSRFKRFLAMENVKTTQDLEITSLKKREDASKQGRNIAELDQDEGISFIQEDAETHGSESGTRKAVPPSQHDLKDKGKAKMIEPEKPLKKKDQIKFDEEVAKRLAEELEAELEEEEEERVTIQREEDANLNFMGIHTQAMMEADYELA